MASRRRICACIGEKSLDSVLSAANKIRQRADVIEIRLDYLAHPSVETIISSLDCSLLFTNRPEWEGGSFSGSEEERIAPLEKAVELGADYIDLELNTAPQYREQLQSQLVGKNSKLILSSHDFNGTPDIEHLNEKVTLMREAGADIGKLITTANNQDDALRFMRVLEFARNDNFPLIAFCMGKAGGVTRVATCDFGGYMTYCSWQLGGSTADGQISVEKMNQIFSLW